MHVADLCLDELQHSLPTDRFQIGRQAIIDRNMETYGFELLFRPIDRLSRDISGEAATSQVIASSMTDADLPTLRNLNKPLFINMTKEHLMNLHLIGLPPEMVIYEILEDIIVDDRLVDRIKMQRGMGYRFALDDFSMNKHNRRLIPLVSYVKLDVLALSPLELEQHVRTIKQYGPSYVKLVAEKVETYEQFLKCQEMGFDYFQGFLFSKPDLITGFALSPVQNSVYRVQHCLNNPECSYQEIAALLSEDPALVYKLLRFIGNTHKVMPADQLTSLLEGIGKNKLRVMMSLFAHGQLRTGPAEIARQALLKAHQSRQVAIDHKLAKPEQYFFAGLISHLDDFTQRPIRSLLSQLPISRQIKEAVTNGTGIIGEVLDAVSSSTHFDPIGMSLPVNDYTETVTLSQVQCETAVDLIIEGLGERLDKR
ncbi:EAL and HDOD domain-containing protein [Neptuniibacter halophilus]|uniref:EAL and HDOD domain-containing protein n=1 Tax=Neptuniibacter halophilus TaxID=651666 RepID=UPI002573FD04|nr:EAL domain-containing protein [Neptuniibacter halophilus]